MYRDNASSFLDDVLLSETLFEYSPAESLINFELPSTFNSEVNDLQLNDVDFYCDAFVSGNSDINKDDIFFSDSPVLFDFADIDKNVDLDKYLEGLNNETVHSPQSVSDSTDSNDATALDRLSVLGIDLASICEQDSQDDSTEVTSTKKEYVQKEVKNAIKVRSWGEPAFCPEVGAFRCPVENCGKLYAKASHVRAHLRRHSGEKPYRCQWAGCSWKFARSDELARHQRSHSGDKPYSCGECNKRFARSDHLAKHGRVHARRAAAAAAAARRANTVSYTRRTRRLL